MSGVLNVTETVVRRLRLFFMVISGLALLTLTLMITADTFFRYVFSRPFPASVEISQLIQPYVVFLPFAYALATGSHVRVTLLTSHLKGRIRKIVELIPFFCGFLFFGILSYVSWLNFWESFRINETMLAAIRLYWWIGKMAMPLGIILITIECLYQFIIVLRLPVHTGEGVS